MVNIDKVKKKSTSMSPIAVPDADRLAKICYQTFESISKTGKPILGKEWTVLSCIAKYEHHTKDLEVVSLGTGTRCIGRSLLSNQGDKLNDSHAEVMCRRGFLLYLYDEISKAMDPEENSIFSFNESKKKFEISSDISFHFMTTFAPCGDASIFDIESSRSEEVIEPSESKRSKLHEPRDEKSIDNTKTTNFTGAKLIYKNTEVPQDLMAQSIGDVRTKPGRGEPTLSISCSDKLAKWNVLGLQGALIYSLLDKPIYYSSITLCDHQHCDIEAAKRAIWKRFTNTKFSPEKPFTVNQPLIQMSRGKKFKYERNMDRDPAPGSIVWSKLKKCVHQVSVNGKLQGATKKSGGRLKISKIELFRCYFEILKKFNDKLNIFEGDVDFTSLRYCDAKSQSTEYQQVWKNLKRDYFKVWATKPSEINMFIIS
ncbi:tRNA-specific adenosine deaminase 1 [Sitodiplosis mosellana]|uniref:tRNA-specific adenosine deaminase 1 n=1 Tax=Sitodiplosis mosellana TaxID=263140 RepID=UPI0024440C21|nr:tRNA-specific adenosine deaminase 1 [Sitodiplosis mosellana]